MNLMEAAIAAKLGGGAVSSVNGQTGAVVLGASDVGALPDSTVIPTVPSNEIAANTAARHTHSNKSTLDTITAAKLLPGVTASDNDKFLRVVSGAWAAVTVPSAESNSF